MSSLYYKQVALAQERGAQRFEYSAIALLKAAHFPQKTIKNDDLNRLEERLNGLEDASCAELKSLHDEIDSQLSGAPSEWDYLSLMLCKAKVLSHQHRKEEALEVCKQIVLLFAPPEPQRDEFESFYEEMNQLRHEKTADLSKILSQLNTRLARGGDTAVQSLKTRLIKAKVLNRMTQNKDALSLCKEIVADRLEDRAGLIVQAKAWNLSGVIYGTLNDREKRLDCYQKGLSLSESIGSLYTAAQALIGLGNARDGNDKVHYHNALNMGKELNDLSIQAQALIGLGNARDGNHKDHYHGALNMGKQLND